METSYNQNRRLMIEYGRVIVDAHKRGERYTEKPFTEFSKENFELAGSCLPELGIDAVTLDGRIVICDSPLVCEIWYNDKLKSLTFRIVKMDLQLWNILINFLCMALHLEHVYGYWNWVSKESYMTLWEFPIEKTFIVK